MKGVIKKIGMIGDKERILAEDIAIYNDLLKCQDYNEIFSVLAERRAEIYVSWHKCEDGIELFTGVYNPSRFKNTNLIDHPIRITFIPGQLEVKGFLFEVGFFCSPANDQIDDVIREEVMQILSKLHKDVSFSMKEICRIVFENNSIRIHPNHDRKRLRRFFCTKYIVVNYAFSFKAMHITSKEV